MIAKIMKGSDFKGVVYYILNDEKGIQIIDADGLFLENNDTIAQGFIGQAQMNPRVTKAVGHIALSFSKEDVPRLDNAVMAKIMDDNFVEYVADAVMDIQSRESSVLPALRKQLEEAESGITNMLNAIQMGILTSSTKERLEALEEQRKELQARIAEERLAKPKMKEEFVRFWLLRFRKLDMTQSEQRQALVDTFINAIYLYDDKVLITFNYKEGTETVAFGEAVKAEKSSDMSARGAPENAVKSKDFMAFLLCNPEKSGLARSMHGFCTVSFFVGILCIGWNCFEMRGKFCIRSAVPDGAAPLLRGRRSSEVPAERS